MNADSLSDLLLAMVALALALNSRKSHAGLALGLGLVGLAACFGVLRYAGCELALGPHRFMSLVAGCAGLPLIAASLRWPQDPLARHVGGAARFAVVAGGIGIFFVAGLGFALWAQALPALAALIILVTAGQRRQPAFIAGAVLLAATFALAAVRAAPFGLSDIQQLHIGMSAAFSLLWLAGRQHATS